MRRVLLGFLALALLALCTGWVLLGTKKTASLAAVPHGFSVSVLSQQVTLPYAMALSPPPSDYKAGISASQAVSEAAKWDQVDAATSIDAVLAVWARPAPVPVDRNTDEPLASPSMMRLYVWDVQISGLCEAGVGGPVNVPTPPACQFNGAHIFIDAQTGEYLGELVANMAS